MELDIEAPVTLTEGAIRELKLITNQPGFESDLFLRIGVKGGGCSGMSYVLGFDKKTDNDNEFVIAGIRCLIEKSHEMYLLGMEIDYQYGLDNRGFTFSNPNASKTCGCGSSFAV